MDSLFYDFKVHGLDGSANLLGALRGKVALAVNVASKCGYTPQYAGLEELYRELESNNFTIIGFPAINSARKSRARPRRFNRSAPLISA